jgi:hypothetical protein
LDILIRVRARNDETDQSLNVPQTDSINRGSGRGSDRGSGQLNESNLLLNVPQIETIDAINVMLQ